MDLQNVALISHATPTKSMCQGAVFIPSSLLFRSTYIRCYALRGGDQQISSKSGTSYIFTLPCAQNTINCTARSNNNPSSSTNCFLAASVVARVLTREMINRVDGRKVVGVFVAGTACCVAVAQIYLPYYVDRDQLIASHELSTQEQREIAKTENTKTKSAGSMWKNMEGRKS